LRNRSGRRVLDVLDTMLALLVSAAHANKFHHRDLRYRRRCRRSTINAETIASVSGS
jgi:hypothetical protein